MHEHSDVTITVDPADRPFKELISGLGRDTGLLIRQEIELAKAEVREKTTQVTKGAATMGIGAFLAYAGMLALVSALVLVLIAVGVTAWVAATIIALVLLVVGYAILQNGRHRIATGKPTLQRTTANAKETVHRLKEQLQ